MKKIKYLFFVQSDFHYLLCKNLIIAEHLDYNDCYFIGRRGTKIDADTQICPFYEGERHGFLRRVIIYMKNRQEVRHFFIGYDIIIYTPFLLSFPNKIYVREIVLFEEGLSAFSVNGLNKKNIKLSGRLKHYIYNSILTIFLSFFNKGIRGYLLPYLSTSNTPDVPIRLVTCSRYSYEDYNHPYIKKIVVPFLYKISMTEEIPPGSYLLVLDRFNDGGRYASLVSYKRCLRVMLNYCIEHGIHEIWTKFHPADWNNQMARNHFEDCVKGLNIVVRFCTERLEYLALQDKYITFVGTNSTILYYAPVMGKSNKSLSFCKYLLSIDSTYVNSINMYGGEKRLIEVLSRNVECI